MNCLEQLRCNEELTMEGMANRLGVSLSFYEKIENGARKPSREFLTKVKGEFPLCDMNIFFTELLHSKCD